MKLDFNILNKKIVAHADALDGEWEVKKPDPFDLNRLASELLPYRDKVKDMVAVAKAHKIIDKKSNELAVTYGTQAHKLLKEVDSETKKTLAPYSKVVSGLRAIVKPFKDDLGGIKTGLKTKIGAYSREQAELERRIAEKRAKEDADERRVAAEAERQADLKRQNEERNEAVARQAVLDKMAEKQGVEFVKVVIPEVVDPGVTPIVESVVVSPNAPIKTEDGTASIIENWTFELEEIEKVPDNYTTIILDEYKVKEAISAGVRTIPGIRIYPDSQVRFRSK